MTVIVMPFGHAGGDHAGKMRVRSLVPRLQVESAVDGGLLRLIIIGVLLLGGCVMTIAP